MWVIMSIYEPAVDSEWLLAEEAIQKVPDASKKAAQTLDATASSLPRKFPPKQNARNWLEKPEGESVNSDGFERKGVEIQ